MFSASTQQHTMPSTFDDIAVSPAIEPKVAPCDFIDNAASSVIKQLTAPSDFTQNAATPAIKQDTSLSDVNQNMTSALCVFFDLETTGLNIRHADVIEVAAVARLMMPDGSWHQRQHPLNKFRKLVRPSKQIPRAITRLTGITNDDVEKHGVAFHIAISAWQSWIRQELHSASEALAVARDEGSYVNGEATPLELWLVGHNILNYDLPLLASQDARQRRQGVHDSCSLVRGSCLFEGLCPFTGVADTLRMARSLTRINRGDWGRIPAPASHKLGCLHRYIVGTALEGAHTALGDAIGVSEICARKPLQRSLYTAILGGHATQGSVKSRYASAGLPLPDALLRSSHLYADIVSTYVQPRRCLKGVTGSRRNSRKSIASVSRKIVSQTVQKQKAVECGNNGLLSIHGVPGENPDMQPVAKKAHTTIDKPARRRWRRGVLQHNTGCLKTSRSEELARSNRRVFKSLRANCFHFRSRENRTGNVVIDVSS